MVEAPGRTLELLDRFCITAGVMELVEWRRRNPWRWKRVYPRWYVEHLKERTNMLNVTGKAEFTNEGKLLEVTTVIQATFPVQHDRLEMIAKMYANSKMENGNLVLRRTLVVEGDLLQKALESAVEIGGTTFVPESIIASSVEDAGQAGSGATSPVDETTGAAASGEGMPE